MQGIIVGGEYCVLVASNSTRLPIIVHIDRNYSDPTLFHFVTSYHNNVTINFMNICAKWYISRQFHNKQSIRWEGFIKYTKLFLLSEKKEIRDTLKLSIGLLGYLWAFCFHYIILSNTSTLLYMTIGVVTRCQ